MNELPDTRESLLLRLADPADRDAWEQFATIYRPVVYRMARLRGLQDADAQDLTQRVLLSVSQSISRWKPQPGARFRNWLSKVAKNAAINQLVRKPIGRPASDSTLRRVESAAEPEFGLEQDYELEYQRQLFRRAAVIVRDRADASTWLAFSLTALEGLSVEETATRLETTRGNVYASRSRIVRRLRDQVAALEAEMIDSADEREVPDE
ncbi:MAG: sigma-70 family RNA polymerase sigma factor [Planctomycetota bacterium]